MPKELKETVADVPRLLSEWDEEENTKEGLFPDKLGSQSNKPAHWKCKCGHRWVAKINSRYQGHGCPRCAKQNKTSFPEQAVFFYVKRRFPDAISRYKGILPNGMELDVYVPSLRIGVEYDGANWHKDSGLDHERNKYRLCKEKGVKLLRIKENREHWGKEDLADLIIRVIPRNAFYLDYAIRTVLSYMGDTDFANCWGWQKEIDLFSLQHSAPRNVTLQDELLRQAAKEKLFMDRLAALSNGPQVTTDVNTKRDRNLIFESYRVQLGEESFAAKHPELLCEWDDNQNRGLHPDMFAEFSTVKVWWKCKNCHNPWKAAFGVRSRGSGCPYCSGRYVLAGFNDLQTRCPEIAAQWHPTKNGKWNPSDFTFGSGHQAWWLCPVCGQSWKTGINNRSTQGHGCPYCEHERPIPGVNDLPTLRPDLMKEWDYEKNEGKDPSAFMPSSNKRVWWKCSKCGYQYQAFINNRNKGTGCKRCAGQIVIPGVNDLASQYPEIAKEWDYEKNGDVRPENVIAKTSKPYWWIDSFGHSWETAPSNRIRGTNCPVCAGNTVLTGFNDLATVYPEIAAEWHPTKNDGLPASAVSKGYSKKAWFICPKCGGEYQSYVGNKIKGYGKCPYCSKRKTRGKRVFLLETGQSFGTLREAAEAVGQTDIKKIQACCAGRTKQAFGFHWEYRMVKKDEE